MVDELRSGIDSLVHNVDQELGIVPFGSYREFYAQIAIDRVLRVRTVVSSL